MRGYTGLPGGGRSPPEPVSAREFPGNRENTGNFEAKWPAVATKRRGSPGYFNGLSANSLRLGTGNSYRSTGNKQRWSRERRKAKWEFAAAPAHEPRRRMQYRAAVDRVRRAPAPAIILPTPRHLLRVLVREEQHDGECGSLRQRSDEVAPVAAAQPVPRVSFLVVGQPAASMRGGSQIVRPTAGKRRKGLNYCFELKLRLNFQSERFTPPAGKGDRFHALCALGGLRQDFNETRGYAVSVNVCLALQRRGGHFRNLAQPPTDMEYRHGAHSRARPDQ